MKWVSDLRKPKRERVQIELFGSTLLMFDGVLNKSVNSFIAVLHWLFEASSVVNEFR